jgi:hypothetical protein
VGGLVDGSGTGTAVVAGGRRGPILRSQAKEGRGSPDDEKGRHGGSLEIIEKRKYKKRGAKLPPVCISQLTDLIVCCCCNLR